MTIFDKFNRVKYLFCSEHPEYFENIFLFKQRGGGNLPKEIEVVCDGKKYNFVYEKDIDVELYMLYDAKDDERCVMINIDSKRKIAVIENLSGDRPACPNGSKLLKATITFLKRNKEKLKINKIVLKDNSLKSCFGKTINFGDMYMLMNGTTWYMQNYFSKKNNFHARFLLSESEDSDNKRTYMSYGFLPYKQTTDEKDKDLIKIAFRNKDIIDNVLVKNVKNLKKYITKYAPKSFKLDKMIEKIDAMADKKLSLYLKWLLKTYDKDTCTLFHDIYKKIMYDLNIQSLHLHSFYMNL